MNARNELTELQLLLQPAKTTIQDDRSASDYSTTSLTSKLCFGLDNGDRRVQLTLEMLISRSRKLSPTETPLVDTVETTTL